MGFIKDFFGSEGVADYFNQMDNGVLDAMDGAVDAMNNWVQDRYEDFFNWSGFPIPGVDDEVEILKPNIYLYAEESVEVAVTFAYPELLTVTIPEYHQGWTVGVTENGQLNGYSEEYDFLFYESRSKARWFQTETGFVLTPDNREAQMEEILDLYGFNEKEKADFIEFWQEKLDADKTYVAYPQGTECLEQVMPLEFSVEPDHLFRLWFGFKECSEAPKLPAVEQIERGAFTVVEWGGYLLDQ